MSTSINFLADDLQWRVIGNWSATEKGKPKQGALNYGFSTQDGALAYIANLLNIATRNEFNVRAEYGHLEVAAPKWCGMEDFQGSYRVAQYIN